MLDFINPKIIAALQIITSIGIIRFWIDWFGNDHKESWLPSGYIEHEKVFVYPDSVLSFLMIISSILIFLGKPLGESLALVCGGMMLFLTVIDIAYFYQHDMFAEEKGGKENRKLIISLSVMSILMIIRFI